MRQYFCPECLAHVEARLRQYPAQVRELHELDKRLTSLSRVAGVFVHAGASGYSGISAPERALIVKQGNKRYAFLEGVTDNVEMALAGLSPRDYEFVRLRYWNGIEMSVLAKQWRVRLATIWRYRWYVLRHVVPVLFPDEP